LGLVRAALTQGSQDCLTRCVSVLRQHDVDVVDPTGSKVVGRVPGHVFNALAHKQAGPMFVGQGTVGEPRKVPHERVELPLPLLPDQSGLDILRQLRRIDARIPVVMVTVARSSDSAIEAMRHGAYDYLHKPIDLQKLDHVINEALKVSRLMREPAVVAETPPD